MFQNKKTSLLEKISENEKEQIHRSIQSKVKSFEEEEKLNNNEVVDIKISKKSNDQLFDKIKNLITSDYKINKEYFDYFFQEDEKNNSYYKKRFKDKNKIFYFSGSGTIFSFYILIIQIVKKYAKKSMPLLHRIFLRKIIDNFECFLNYLKDDFTSEYRTDTD